LKRWLSASCVIVAAACILVFLVLQSSSNLPARIEHRTIVVDGVERSYRLVIPDEELTGTRRPLLVALHGALDTTDEMAAYTQLDRLAVEKNFLLVYPQGENLNWHPMIPIDNPEVAAADILFIDLLCDDLTQTLDGDPKRIYVAGVSMGGAMCTLLLTHLSERFAGAVCNCGWLPDPLGKEPLNTKNKCPILFYTGAEDRQVSSQQVQDAREAFEKAGHPTQLKTIQGFGHGWAVKHGINEEIWSFLSPYHLP
jgi:poly(3-hydroxybutyrate) depolymerase